MARMYWEAIVPPIHILSGAAFTTFTTYQDISPAPAIKIPANLLEPGSELVLNARGHFSNTSTPTLSVGFFWGTAAVPLGQGVAVTTTTSTVAWPWQLEYRGRVRAVGTAGSIYGQGKQYLPTSITALVCTATPIGVGAAWGTSNAANTITVEHFTVELIS